MTEEVQAWLLGLRRGRALAREGAPPLLPIERLANLQERKDRQSGHEGGGPTAAAALGGLFSIRKRYSRARRGAETAQCPVATGSATPPTGLRTQRVLGDVPTLPGQSRSEATW